MPDLHLKFGNHLKLDDLLPHVQSRECRVAILPAIHAKCHQAPASLLLEFPDHPAQEDYRNIKKVTDSGIGCQFAMELPSLANKSWLSGDKTLAAKLQPNAKLAFFKPLPVRFCQCRPASAIAGKADFEGHLARGLKGRRCPDRLEGHHCLGRRTRCLKLQDGSRNKQQF